MTEKNKNKNGGVFLTQSGEKMSDVKREITDLEQLLAVVGQTSQSTLLLKKKKEMREVDISLNNMKIQHKQRMDTCEERRIQFELKQNKMREQVLRFEKFIQENDAKRLRAENKIKQEKKLYDDKIKEIQMLTDKLNNLDLEQKRLTSSLANYSRYKVFLERILEENELGYEEISDILNRHSTLREANSDLMKHSTSLEQEVDEFRKKLHSITTEKQNQSLVNTSIIQDNQTELEKLFQNVKLEEADMLLLENKKKDISREFSQITQAIKNLFLRCYNTMRIKPTFGPNKDTATMTDILDYDLETICMRVSDLFQISMEYKQYIDTGGGNSGQSSSTHSIGGGAGSSSDLKENSTYSIQTNSHSIP